MNRYTTRIIQQMSNKNSIRNICIVSHVDHGKTTLSDYLLQAGGLVSRTLAGSARVLDYLDEEQQRGITIKTANISFIYEHLGDSFLINLVDTPGHVDFSGMVSQALRLVDGAIVVVDAVEGVMAQTDSVIKQAMDEGLKPILFINKIDRLINELQLKQKEIENRLNTIVQLINELIFQYAPPEWKNQWKVNFGKGTVVIGSALHGWAISKFSSYIPKFDEIIQKHKLQEINTLKETNSIISALMPAIINTTPSPLKAQKNRIKLIVERISENDLNDIKTCNSNGNIIICIGKLMYEKNRGLIALGRVFSGTIERGITLTNVRTSKSSRVHQVCIYKGQSLLKVDKVEAGNIAAIIGLEDIIIGDTLTDKKEKDFSTLFKQIAYLQESVISVRIEPTNLSNIPKLEEELKILSLIKPNFSYSIDEDTGEFKIYGIGELQLEIIIGDIKKKGLNIEVSDPEVAFAEQIEKSISYTAKDSMENVEISIVCEPSKEKVEGEVIYQDMRNNHLILKMKDINPEIIDLLIIGFKNAIIKGVKTLYPIRNLTVYVKDIKEIETGAFRYEIIVPAFKRIIHQALVEAEIDIYEPIFNIQITTPVRFLGQILSVFQRFGGIVEDTQHLDLRTIITGKISVESSLTLANELRHASEGFAFWQFTFAGYKRKRN
ncbi:MAG: GTP-binding protein [Candidatus Heimdallarchaeaceae archaeon]